jgi:hypothetical protein
MRRLFNLLFAAFCLLAAGTRASAQVPILYYDFENNTTRTTFENAVEQSVNGGSGALSRLSSGTITGPAGAGTYNGGAAAGVAASTSSWQSATIDPGTAATDYFQFTVNTTGFSQVSLTFDNQASATGPASVGLMYSTNGTNFTAVAPVPTGNAGFSTPVFDLSGVSAVDNQTSVTIRIYAYAGNADDRSAEGRSAFTTGGTFKIDNLTVRARTVTASKTLLDYPSVGLSTKSGTAFVPAYSDLFVNGSGINVSLNGELKLLGTLGVTSGTLDQGAASNLTAGTVSVAAGGTLKNQGTGDLNVGAGGVANDGTINFDGGGAACSDDILIRSNADSAQRTWSGAGAFSLIDVDVKDQKAAGVPTFPVIIIAASSKDSGNNANWTFTSDPTCASGSYTWVGGTGNDWQSPASWSPARLLPGVSDVLIFDGGVTPAPAVNNVPTQTVATLKLINSAAVTLNASTLSPSQTLTLSGAQGLLVPFGSSLTLSSGNALRLNVASGAAATIGGGMVFEGGAHRLLGNASAAVTFQSGATFGTSTGFNGNPFGTGAAGDGTAGSIVFANGSAYFHNAGESPFGGAGSSAVAVFQTGSTATWLTSGGFQASGRAYADLVVGMEDPGGVAVNLSDTGAGDFRFDNLTINSTASANSSLQFAGTGASTVSVRGNVTSKGAGLGTIPDVTLGGGTGGVVISKPGGGAVTFSAAGNARALDFESSAQVAAGTTLTLGRVLVAGLNASNNFVVTVEGALEGSSGGYVVGKLRRQLSGTGTSVFQVGSANGYSPVTLGVTSNSNGSPAPFTVSAAGSYMTGVVSQSKSVKRTYTLTSGAPEGSITADITFQYLPSPTTSGGDVSADVVESTLNAFRREAGDAPAEFAASARGVNTVTVGGINSFSEWTLANARPCALTVNTTADPSGAGGAVSLREALRDVCAGGTVNFDLPADSVITLGSELSLTRNVQIAGPPNRLTVSGGGAARVFNVNSGASAYVSNLNVTGGAAPSGGAVQNSGTLTLVGVSLFGNNATGGGGGAVRNDGTLNLVNSTLSGNNAAPAISDGGALLVAAGKTATLLNTTVTDNTAGRDGNGIYNGGTLLLKNSVVARNGSAGVDLFDAGTTTESNSITSGTPGLSALAFRGGPTKTHVPLPDSAAVNAGTDATALGGPVDDTQTTVNVADDAAVPLGLLIRVDDEQMLVTAKSAGVLTVTRGANGSKVAAHLGGAAVNPAFDQRGLPRRAGSAPDIGAAESNYAVSANAGTPQSATIGTAFVSPFKAAVTESGDPVGGLSVTFAAPAAGASGTFQTTGTNAATVTTDSGGVATAPAFSANGVAGGYSVTVGLAGGSPSAGFGLTNLKLDQTITFNLLSNKTFGDADFTPGASASSGLGVTFAASGPCGVSGSQVHITGAGVCTITASQAGGENYNAALDVQRSFQIAKASTATALSSVPNPSGAGQPVTLAAAVTSAAGTPTGTVTFKDGGAAVAGCESRALSSGQATCATSALGAGGHALTAEYSGDPNFNASAGSLSGAQTVGGAFEFSRSSYTAAERGGFVTVTVRRAGDTSQAASVDYSTDDGSVPAFAVACSAATGQALERCDYTRAAGTLRFAAGEAEKTFVVLVGDDSFNEGTETARLRLSDPSDGALLGGQSSAVLEITDDATESAGNVIDDDEAFVREHYHDFLNREADAEGLKFWTDGIKACGADAGCREVKRVHTSAAFFLSIEFQETGYFAYRIHKAAFGDLASDRPVPLALKDFLRDTQRLGGGVVVGRGDWRRQLDENKAAFAVEFVRRPEFLTRHPEVMNPTDFVNALDADAGGVLSEREKAALVLELLPNPADASLRALVLMKVADNPALARREKNRAFVLMQYVGYLRRNPNDAPEEKLDFAGYNFWLGKLDSFDGDFIGAEMVKAFINSVEYRGRFGR